MLIDLPWTVAIARLDPPPPPTPDPPTTTLRYPHATYTIRIQEWAHLCLWYWAIAVKFGPRTFSVTIASGSCPTRAEAERAAEKAATQHRSTGKAGNARYYEYEMDT